MSLVTKSCGALEELIKDFKVLQKSEGGHGMRIRRGGGMGGMGGMFM
jgi:hypothetical protein